MANKSGAKIILSLHLNSNDVEITEGGVEIYAGPNSDLTFAKLLATNIVNLANTSYSQMEIDKEAEGVYVRTIEVDRNRTSSFTRNYTGIFNSIPYLFIIRETGGIATGAYVDDTNQSSYVEAISTSIDEFYKITKK